MICGIEKEKLSQTLIANAKDVPSTGTFWRRFGGLRNTYRLIGYAARQASLEITFTRRRLLAAKVLLLIEIVKAVPSEVCVSRDNRRQRHRLRLNNTSIVTVHLCRPHRVGDGSSRWYPSTGRKEFCNLSLVARMNTDNSTFLIFIYYRACAMKRGWL